MIQLHSLGYWMVSLQDFRYFLPQELVGEMDQKTKQTVIEYLRRGVVYNAYRGYSWCRFLCGAEGPTLGADELTDGRWVWPRGLVHYVEEHRVVLPDLFLKHVIAGGSTIESADGLPAPSDELWVTWCSQQSSGALQDSIKSARDLASAQERILWEERIRKFELKNGLSERACASSGCSSKAANGWTLCPRCALDAGGGHELNDGYFPSAHHFYLGQVLMAARSASEKAD